MPSVAHVRTSTTQDRDAVLELVGDAFSAGGRHADEELEIVRSTWALEATPPGFELVATWSGVVVGHVLAARGSLDGREVLGVAPLAVAPARQGEGIGTALMAEIVRRAEEAALPLLVLLGSPDYYRRFGFEPSGPLGIIYRPVGEASPHFLVRRFPHYDSSLRGDFTYCWEAPRG